MLTRHPPLLSPLDRLRDLSIKIMETSLVSMLMAIIGMALYLLPETMQLLFKALLPA